MHLNIHIYIDTCIYGPYIDILIPTHGTFGVMPGVVVAPSNCGNCRQMRFVKSVEASWSGGGFSCDFIVVPFLWAVYSKHPNVHLVTVMHL